LIGPALALSLLVSALATAVVALAGTASGRLVARSRFRGREIADALCHLPLVLPPTVVGYGLLLVFGRNGWIGGTLRAVTGFSIPFTWVACVLAAAVMAFPMMHRAARAAFEGIDRRHEMAAASLGASRLRSFLTVELPLARRGLTAGVTLAYARALGEFGATLILAGNIPGRTQTLALAVYESVIAGEHNTALVLSVMLSLVSVAALLLVARLSRAS
jgi:molybdate transport system permease protein